MRRSIAVALIALLVSFGQIGAQVRDSTPLEHRAGQLRAILNGAPFAADSLFAPSFLAEVPATQLRTVLKQLATQYGAVTTLAPTVSLARAATRAVFRVTLAKGMTIDMTVGVSAAAPNLIGELIFGSPSRNLATLADVMHEFAVLPGHVSALVARIDSGRIVPIAEHDSGSAMAIGSAFKLYILSALLRDVESGSRHWSDVVPLDEPSRSLPSGVLQSWPLGTPVTLQTLATLMISQSDNTAADRLLHVVGREKVEATLAMTGNARPQRDMPFLTTREMFVLKSPAGAVLMARFLRGTTAVRRSALVDADQVPYAQVTPDFSHGPVAIDSVEWFASASDLARAMLWIRDHSARGETEAARDVLAVNPGLGWPAGTWTYTGFKGGSEPGVIDLTFLLRRPDGKWFILTAAWNNPAKVVDEVAFAALVKRAGELVAAH